MSDNTSPSLNPCRYGYLYGFQPLAAAPLAIGEVRKHKPRSGDAPAIANLSDYFLYTVSRTAFERALCGKSIQLPLVAATYAAALDSEANVVLASPIPLPSATEAVNSPDALVDYLAHLYRTGGREAVEAFLARNPHPAARAHIAEVLGFASSSTPAEFADICLGVARASVDPINLNPATRAFVAAEVAPVLAASWELSSAPRQRFDLTYTDEDVALGAHTGVLSLDVDRSTDRLLFTAYHRPDSPGLPAVVVNHSRGILEVVPLLPPQDPKSAEKVLSAWAEAVPVIGGAAKAAVVTAYHLRPDATAPAPTVTAGASSPNLAGAVSVTLEPPAFHNFSEALDAADRIGAAAGLDETLRRELRQRLLADSGTGIPRWMYRSHLVAQATTLAHYAELGYEPSQPVPANRGSAHPDFAFPPVPTPAAETEEVIDLTDSGPYTSQDAPGDPEENLREVVRELEQTPEVRRLEVQARVIRSTGDLPSAADHVLHERSDSGTRGSDDRGSDNQGSGLRRRSRRGFDFPVRL